VERSAHNPARSGALPWVPLLVASLSSYGPIGYNYGFALYFLTWRHGFVKRALVGELFSHVSQFTRGQLLTIEYLFLAAAFALTYIVFRRMLFGPAADARLAVLLLSAPAVLPHIGYLFAQPDVTLYLFLLVCLYAFLNTPPMTAAMISLPLCCLTLLAHEAFSLMFYPLIAAILLQFCRTRKLPWAVGLMHVAVVFAAFVAVLHFGTLKVSPDTVLSEATARTSVGIQRQVYDVMSFTLQQQRALVHTMYSTGVLWTLALTLVIALPYFLLLISLLRRVMRAAAAPAWQQALTAAMLVSPLLLCALGHDTTRWIGAMCLDASLFVLFLFLHDDENGPVRATLREWATGPTLTPWLAYAIAVGPFGATGIRSAEAIYAAFTGN
jgi:hypothetical protein